MRFTFHCIVTYLLLVSGGEVQPTETPPSSSSSVVTLTSDLFQETKSGNWFVMFYAPWSSHSQKLIPIWESLGKEANLENHFQVAKLDCTVHSSICTKQEIVGYPSLKLFLNGLGDDSTIHSFSGLRSVKRFIQFYHTVSDEKEVQTPIIATNVIVLTDKNFVTETQSGVVLVMFYAPWCKHSEKISPIWEDLATNQNAYFKTSKLDCTIYTALCTQLGIKSYPTVKLFVNGFASETYRGDRTMDSFISYAKGEGNNMDELKLKTPEQEKMESMDKSKQSPKQPQEQQPQQQPSQEKTLQQPPPPQQAQQAQQQQPSQQPQPPQQQPQQPPQPPQQQSPQPQQKTTSQQPPQQPQQPPQQPPPQQPPQQPQQQPPQQPPPQQPPQQPQPPQQQPQPPQPPQQPEQEFGEGSYIIELTEDNFDREVSSSLGPIMVKFYAPWCGHCKKLVPIWETTASTYKNKFRVAKLDCTAHPSVCIKFSVTSYPTIKLFLEGKHYDYAGQRQPIAFSNFVDRVLRETHTQKKEL